MLLSHRKVRALSILIFLNLGAFVMVEGAYSIFFNKQGTPALFWKLYNYINIITDKSTNTSISTTLDNPPKLFTNESLLRPEYIVGYEQLANYSEMLGNNGIFIGGDSIAAINKINKKAYKASGHNFGNFKRFDKDGRMIGFEPNQIYYTGQIKFLELNSNEIFRIPTLYTRLNKFSDEAEMFREKYVSNWIKQTTNPDGYRTSLKPLLDNSPLIVCIGDSLTWGAYVADNETYCSKIAEYFPQNEVLNAGVMGAQFEDNLARLESVLSRYGNRTATLIYQHSANDMFLPNGDILEPEIIVSELKSILSKHDIQNIIFFAHHHALYTVPKSIAKVSEVRFNLRRKLNEKLKNTAEAAGFTFFSTKKLFEQEVQDTGSQFASLSLLTDHTHLSVKGHQKLGAELINMLKNF